MCLQVKAQDCRNRFEELVKKDLSVFEERRLQDVLMCRVQAPTLSVKDEDFHTVWEHRLADLLDKRQLYQQVRMCPSLCKMLTFQFSHYIYEGAYVFTPVVLVDVFVSKIM